jgi:hypothetical protein
MFRPSHFKFVIRCDTTTAIHLQITHPLIDKFKRARLIAGAALPIHNRAVVMRQQGPPSSSRGKHARKFPVADARWAGGCVLLQWNRKNKLRLNR